MRHLTYIEIENFKRFGESQRIELDHPSVLIGPNNCGKTSLVQALALWSQAVQTWWDTKGASNAKERTATALNRLEITAVPVTRTRFFWHNTRVRTGNQNILISITVGVLRKGVERPVKMLFRHQGDELVYCTPDEAHLNELALLEYAASIHVELLYPMSGLTTEEPVVKPGRINVLLGQGETAQVLRNLCLMVYRDSPDDWRQVVDLMRRLFSVELGDPDETSRGAIELHYNQEGTKDKLDLSMSGRGFQQLLLIFAYLYSHKGSVLLIDEPDAHLEILRQKQVYVLLRDIALRNDSQVMIATHSEVILNESLDHNLTLLLEGKAENLAKRNDILNSLTHYGAEHYVKAREREYVLYVEGNTDLDILRAFAAKLDHPVAERFDGRINAYYVQDNYPEPSVESELERVEGGFGITPEKHFFALRQMIPDLKGLAILDGDARPRENRSEGGLDTLFWKRYEAENYFITPALLIDYATQQYEDQDLFAGYTSQIRDACDEVTLSFVFDGSENDFRDYLNADPGPARLIWEAKTANLKLSHFAEQFFETLAERISMQVLLRKGEFHRLIDFMEKDRVPAEVGEKLASLNGLFQARASLRKEV